VLLVLLGSGEPSFDTISLAAGQWWKASAFPAHASGASAVGGGGGGGSGREEFFLYYSAKAGGLASPSLSWLETTSDVAGFGEKLGGTLALLGSDVAFPTGLPDGAVITMVAFLNTAPSSRSSSAATTSTATAVSAPPTLAVTPPPRVLPALHYSHPTFTSPPPPLYDCPAPETTLSDCLASYFNNANTWIDWYCPECKTPTSVTCTIQLATPPPLLVLQLMWYSIKYRGSAANFLLHEKIALPLADPPPRVGDELDLRKYQPLGATTPAVYRIYAIVHHWGPSAHSGHYTADIKQYDSSSTSSTLRADDTVLYPLSEAPPQPQGTVPYLLFLELLNPVVVVECDAAR